MTSLQKLIPCRLKKNKSRKYIYVTGYFNTYTALNNTVNGYADGIITYIFDYKTKKLKASRIEQYRVFRLPKTDWDERKFPSWLYAVYMHVPQVRWVGNIDKYRKDETTVFQKLKSGERDEIEVKEGRLQEKDFALLGYHFFDVKTVTKIAYTQNSQKQLENLIEYNEKASMKLKYKSEPNYNMLNVQANFYPTSFDSGDHKDDHKVKFDLDRSYYTSKYWEDPAFPDMQTVLNSFQKGDLKEQQNMNSTHTIKHTT